ncbi:PHP domain-containing protein [Faecalibaculum rodentium]|uniref:PHP domain-containing protein n=3 Tax=Faecalibaculum rodentium TaxID=1702221 RepID=UPI00272DA11B|nr:PHP domain-containing protein [Faecalibaculum rodentium]
MDRRKDRETVNTLRKTYALILKKAQLYRNGGWQYARVLKRTRPDYESHFYAFLIDLNICLLPVYIWIIEFLLILCGILPPHVFDLLFYLMYGLLFLTSVIGLGLVTARLHGQSIGYAYTGLKLVRRDKRPAPAIQVILRQALGIGVPLMVFGIVFEIWGMFLWLVIHMCICLATPHQQNLMDLLLRLVTVRMPDDADLLKGAGQTQETAACPVKEPVKKTVQVREPVRQEPQAVSPIDLHIRSNYSDDAQLDVEEIFKQARAKNMEIISITDHNCARANAPANRLAGLYGIQYIPGVEFDCELEGTRLRILGYYIDWTSPVFDTLERDSLKREKDASMVRARLFQETTGIQIDIRSLLESSRFQVISGRDITRMVFHNEETRQLPFVRRYLDTAVSAREARRLFEHDIFGKGGPCYVRPSYPQASHIIRAIHDAGGLAVLANWHLDSLSRQELDRLVKLGIDGVEVFMTGTTEDLTVRLLDMANREKLFVTAGSDYHGPARREEQLGVTGLPEKAEGLVRLFTSAAGNPGKTPAPAGMQTDNRKGNH